ncbi:hypothetical protein M902_1940 [Bacteriovorax sp. BAL6_X]|uniref:hypothetical protein n=1 Tax=Bacteriovorax sp. BAL6_X TaxID=1201290 RepID=UPI000385B5CA|nr:hypothetical protein [Bacteriovorax sp. BAL6_X]EPZ52007.1 hypothetical protein M902_1940 [Bacteriovorax sp. BAL6_X]
MEELRSILDDAVTKFSSNEYYDKLRSAKEEYFKLAGKLSEEDEDYESRMNGFVYWYITQRDFDDNGPLIKKFVNEISIEENQKDSMLGINHSLFEYRGQNLFKKHVFKDILHNTKFYIPKNEFTLQLVKDDLFIARTISYEGKTMLLDDISVLPYDARGPLVKESKKVRKLNDRKRDMQFLLRIESLKTKWRQYGHIDPKKIFVF